MEHISISVCFILNAHLKLIPLSLHYSNLFLPFLNSGFIPKNQHYFAKRYGEVCRSAIYHHEIDQQKNKQLRDENNHRITWKVNADATATSPQKTVSKI